MLRVALSGGIASGKTTVSNAFAELGVPVVDADILSRKVVEPDSEGLSAVVDRFGQTILQTDGTLDRKQLRQIIFSEPTARAELEKIIHPRVRELTRQFLDHQKAIGSAYCIVVIPLLVETSQQQNYDHIVIVDVERQTQIDRLMARDNNSLEQAESILKSQASRKQRLAIADDVISNTETLDDTKKQVKVLHKKLTDLAIKFNN